MDERLANGMYAVDLGACPGGWTYQLVGKRNMWVSSVDNGPMAQSLMDTGQVTWLREDGFKYRPTRNNISWMVCDMVEKPAKVAALMAQWLVNGWCRETIFNLKLPMKNATKSYRVTWPIFRNSSTSTVSTRRSRRASCITIAKR